MILRTLSYRICAKKHSEAGIPVRKKIRKRLQQLLLIIGTESPLEVFQLLWLQNKLPQSIVA